MSDNRDTTGIVGPGRPPIDTQFKEGQSGNPAGRPRGSRNIKTILRELLDLTEEARNPITGETHEVTQLDIMLAKLVTMAKHGDLAAFDRVADRLEGRPDQKTKSENVNTNLEVTPETLDKLTDDQIARMAAIVKESADA